MKRRALFFFLLVLLAGCAATQNMPQMTYMMNSASKIQYYQEQINHYQFLIEQEKLKQAKK